MLYCHLDCSKRPLLVDFGDVNLGEMPVRELVVENKTGIAAPFSLVMKNFYSRPPTPPATKPAGHAANLRYISEIIHLCHFK